MLNSTSILLPPTEYKYREAIESSVLRTANQSVQLKIKLVIVSIDFELVSAEDGARILESSGTKIAFKRIDFDACQSKAYDFLFRLKLTHLRYPALMVEELTVKSESFFNFAISLDCRGLGIFEGHDSIHHFRQDEMQVRIGFWT